jgi:hypothetical protein
MMSLSRTIDFTEYREACWDFACNVDETTAETYKKRNQGNSEYRKVQAYTGKLAEWSVHRYLTKIGMKVTEPDMRILKPREKSFDYDLKIKFLDKTIGLHVKSQTKGQAIKFGESIMFQVGDRARRSDHIAICIIDERKSLAEIVGLPRAFDLIKNGLLKEPKKKELRGIKRVLYLEDFRDFLPYEMQWALLELIYKNKI